MCTWLLKELKGELGWSRFNFYESSCCEDTVHDNVERISYAEVDEETFIERYERPNLPIVIDLGLETWEAKKKWTLEVCVCVCAVVQVG